MGGHHAHGASATSNIKIAFFLNLSFTLIELVGGLWTNSVAIISDAVHDLGDSLSLGLAWYFVHLSKQGPTSRNTYGYQRYSLLGGLITAVVLMIGLGFILWHAVGRLLSPEEVNAPGMMALAVVGILFNGAAVLRVRKGSSLTERIVSWHLLEDTLGWVAVLLGAGAIAIWDLPIIDPLLSIAISCFILWNVVKNMKQFFHIFLQLSPASFDRDSFEQHILSLPKAVSLHHTHSWTLDGESHVLTTHVVMEKAASRGDVLKVKNEIQEFSRAHGFTHVTADVEFEGEICVSGDEHGHGHGHGHDDTCPLR